MKILNKVLPVVAAMTFMSAGLHADYCDSGDHSQFERELNEKDWQALYDYINTKRTINLQEKSCNLTIAGDVRVDWLHTCEEKNGFKKRDVNNGKGFHIGKNDFDIECNLYFDYVSDRTWAVAQLQFDNSAGVSKWQNEKERAESKDYDESMHGSGVGCNLDLKKAYIGYNLCCDGCTRFDIEVGRRHLYHVFDSEVQFLSRFDGLLLKYDTSWDCMGDWYVHLGGFVIDSRVNHYAWIIETGLLNIYDCGLDIKYSFVDWYRKGKNVIGKENPNGNCFEVSQFTFTYHVDPEILCMPAKTYGAILWNSAANKMKNPPLPTKHNLAWYAGFRVGEVVYEGDWAVDLQYQWVQAFAVPDQDMSGIGTGNIDGTAVVNSGYGNTNFKGWRLEVLYALTDNISLDARIQWSNKIDTVVNQEGKDRYSQFRLEAIYAF